MQKPLIVGLQGRVVALDVHTGEVLWHNELHGSGSSSVALAVTEDWVFASASAARMFCLNRQTGAWCGRQRPLDLEGNHFNGSRRRESVCGKVRKSRLFLDGVW